MVDINFYLTALRLRKCKYSPLATTTLVNSNNNDNNNDNDGNIDDDINNDDDSTNNCNDLCVNHHFY